MTTKKTEASASDAIKKLEAKDGEANNESARTNEILAARDGGKDSDPAKESLKLNDPSLSRSAYTSDKTGFNEDIDRGESEDAPKLKTKAKD